MWQPKVGGTTEPPSKESAPRTYDYNDAFYADTTESLITNVPGAQGLKNHGNTCYLNSALQLLSHVIPLTTFLLLEKDDTEKKPKPVTSRYARLLRAMWCSSDRNSLNVCVKSLAKTIRKKTNSFKENIQHDCEELLCKMLDFMHEELKCEQDENPKVEPRPEMRQGDTLEDYPQQAENSIIADQFRIITCQTVTCNKCQFETRKPDRTHILQLTYQNTVPKDVFWMPLDLSIGVIPTLFRLDVPKPYTVKEMREVLLQKVEKSEKTKVTFMNTFSEQFTELEDTANVTEIEDRMDIYAFEYPDDEAIIMLPTVHVCEDKRFGQNVIFPFRLDDLEVLKITKQLLKYMERYVRVPKIDAALHEEDEPVDESEQMDVAQEETEDADVVHTLDYIETLSDDSNNSKGLESSEEGDSKQKHGGDSSKAPDVVVDMEKGQEKDETEDMAKEKNDDNEKTAMDTGEVVPEVHEQGADVGGKVQSESDSGKRTDREEDKTWDTSKAAAELLQLSADAGGEDKENDPHGQKEGMQAGDDNVMDTMDTTAAVETSSPTQRTVIRRRKREKTENSPFTVRGCKLRSSEENQNNNARDLTEANYLQIEWSKESRKLYDLNKAEMFNQTHLVNTLFNSSAPLTLQSMLKSFVDVEYLRGSNAYDCQKCGGKQSATRRTVIKVLPPYLIVHFKSRQTVGDKDDQFVDFPIKDLDLSGFLGNPEEEKQNKPLLYDLIAVCNHKGSMEEGHYRTYAKNKLDGRWRLFDDDKVFLMKLGVEEEMITNQAYVLLYERRQDNAKMAEALGEAMKAAKLLEDSLSPADDLSPLVPPPTKLRVSRLPPFSMFTKPLSADEVCDFSASRPAA